MNHKPKGGSVTLRPILRRLPGLFRGAGSRGGEAAGLRTAAGVNGAQRHHDGHQP